MNLENDDLDLGLGLGYPNQGMKTRLGNDSGAGVNAGSGVDMTFVTADPLSELVWSPQKGLSLKCADFTFFDNKPSLLWDVGPSNIVFPPSQSIKFSRSDDNRPVNEGNLMLSQMALHTDGELADKIGLADLPSGNANPVAGCRGEKTGSSGKIEVVNAVGEVSLVQFNQKEECQRGSEIEDFYSPNNTKIANISENSEKNAGHENQRQTVILTLGFDELTPATSKTEPFNGKFKDEMVANCSDRIIYASGGTHKLSLEVALASGICTLKQSEAFDGPVPSLPSPRERQESALAMEEEVNTEMKMHGSKSKHPLKKLKPTAENDLQHLIARKACCQNEGTPHTDQPEILKSSQTNRKVYLCQNKSKEKALSDGDVNERMPKNKDDSQGSVESCNSAGLISIGKKRGSFEQRLIVGTKRSKKQSQEGPASTLLVGTDSSFINWISNMVKGLSKYSQDEVHSADLTLPHPDNGQKTHDQKFIAYDKNHDSGGGNMGIQTIFQSLYLANTKVQEERRFNDDYPKGESREQVLTDKTCVDDIAPKACHGENDKSSRHFFLSSNCFNRSNHVNDEGPSTHPWTLLAKFAGIQSTCMSNSAENKTSINLECTKEKVGGSSSASSLGNHNTRSVEKNNPIPPSEGMALHNVGNRNDPLRSLWLSRFSPKTPVSMLNINHCNHSSPEMLDSFAANTRLISCTQNCLDCPIDKKKSEAWEYSAENPINVGSQELQNGLPSTDFGFKRIGHSYKMSSRKLNPVLPSQKFNSSETMATLFARRLDALKNIIPSVLKDNATHTTPIMCFFCGRSDHDTYDCSRTTETELEELLKNIISYDWAEVSPCLCIRCFCLGHWAVTCPMSLSSRQQQSGCDSSLANHQIACKLQLCTDNKGESCTQKRKECSPHFVCNGKKLPVDADHRLNPKWCAKMISDRRLGSDEVWEHVASNSGENKLKQNQIVHCNFVNWQISDVPRKTFDAIRRLRLSRSNILKLMNSQISISNLDGFFLRLRLRKWEGLGGAGYCVACITGANGVKSPMHSVSAISVNVGGVRCMVDCQYISNNDFLEDELMAWWCTTLRSGAKIPSEDELKSKFFTRKKLGL